MEAVSRDLRSFALAANALGAGGLLAIAPAGSYAALEFSGLIVTGILASAFVMRGPGTDDAAMSPSFVVEFAALVLLGGGPAALIAGAASIVRGRFAGSTGRVTPRR